MTIKALVGLLPDFDRHIRYKTGLTLYPDQLELLVSTIKPLADGTHVVVGSVFLNDLRAIADTGGRRIETAMDACDKIVELIDMEARLGPAASPAPVDGELVERVARALHLHDFPRSPWEEVEEIFKNQWRSKSRAALASVKEVE